VVGGVLPVLILDALIGLLGVGAMILGLLIGALGSKMGGTRRMLYLAPAVGVAAGLGAITAYGWAWVALLATSGVITGIGIRFGWLPTLLMLPFAVTFAAPTSSGKDAAIYAVIVVIATLYGIVIARRFKARAMVEGDRRSIQDTVAIAIVFGVALGASAAIGVALGWTQPYWVPEPILILVIYVIAGRRERIREKAVGTTIGVVAAIPVAIIAPPALAITSLAILSLLVALIELKLYWLYYGFFTFALVLALSPPGHVGSEAAHRGVEILTGIGILVVGLAIIHPLSNYLSKRYPQPELA
jgi:hypothetical protein